MGSAMRLKITPFNPPQYAALRKRSESLAFMWGMGHVFFVLFLIMAIVAPISVVLAAMIDADLTRERSLDVIESSIVASLLISGIGFAVRQYAAKKGKIDEKPSGE